jgi:hypothetical protein
MIAVVGDMVSLLGLRRRLVSRLLLRSFTDRSRREAPFRLAAVVALAVVSLILVSSSLGILFTHALQGAPPEPFFLPAIRWSAAAAGVGIFFYAGLTLSATLTNRNDITMLLLAPLSARAVLADRLFAVSGSFSVLLAIVGLPNLLGAGDALHAGTPFVATSLVVILLLPVAPCAVGLLLVVTVLRFVSPRYARLATASATAVGAVVLYLITESADPMVLLPGRSWHLFPVSWPGSVLAAVSTGDTASASAYLAGTVCLDVLLIWAGVSRAARLLASGWATYTESPGSRSGATIVAREYGVPALPCQASDSTPWRALFRREWLSVRRDPKLLAQLAYPLLVEGFTLYKAIGNPFTTHPLTGRLERLFAGALYLSATLTAVFLLTILALPIVGREGKSLYLLGASPLRARDILAAKIAFCAAPIVVLVDGLFLVFGTRLLRLTPEQTIFDALALAALLIALSAWLVCVGVIWPRISSDSSRRQLHGMALMVGPISGTALCGIVGWLIGLVYEVSAEHVWVRAGAGLGIFVLTGATAAAVMMVGPRLLRDVLTGDRRPV